MRIRAENLGKAYRLYRRPIDSLKELLSRRAYGETLWAVRDVTLEIAQGDSLGIVGDNGAGKSTLLRLLAGAIQPTTGRVERGGRTASLLTLGGGFHPDLSGTENVRIGCAVLGLSPARTNEILPAILDFAELGAFIDRPVRTYSSGMYLRLAFSVATAVDPDVLIVDEHLSVGDQHFRFKCKRKIMALREAGCTIVLCSHDTHAIIEVCDRTLWLRDGRPAMLSDTQETLKAYDDHVRLRDAASVGSSAAGAGSAVVRESTSANSLCDAVLGGDCRDGVFMTGSRLELTVVVRLTPATRADGVNLALVIVRNDGVWAYGSSTKVDRYGGELHPLGDDRYGVTFVIDELPLLSGHFSFLLALQDYASPHTFHYWADAAPFRVIHAEGDRGMLRVPHRWEAPKPATLTGPPTPRNR
jgi:lipopolysaccharide transport system ATP-binding protein